MTTIGSTQLIKETGISPRQLDYWVTNYVIEVVNGKNSPGSGYYRKFDISIIPRVELLAKVANVFSRNVSLDLLRRIYQNYDEGKIEIAEDVFLMW